MIRKAKVEDLDRIMEIAAEPHEKHPFFDHMELDAKSVIHLIAASDVSEDVLPLVWEQDGKIEGIFCSAAAPHPLNNNFKIATTFAWWLTKKCKPGAGARFIKEAERIYSKNGVKFNCIGYFLDEHFNPKATGEFLMRLGYDPIEISTVKVLT